jgi:hypothetical protein
LISASLQGRENRKIGVNEFHFCRGVHFHPHYTVGMVAVNIQWVTTLGIVPSVMLSCVDS